ncbi:MAG: hypothetical protein NTX82_03855 [Candidatus Parcubacteria bacterium]|nr:hypothetical protein [Candidatus Parcubacteria bacterium]
MSIMLGILGVFLLLVAAFLLEVACNMLESGSSSDDAALAFAIFAVLTLGFNFAAFHCLDNSIGDVSTVLLLLGFYILLAIINVAAIFITRQGALTVAVLGCLGFAAIVYIFNVGVVNDYFTAKAHQETKTGQLEIKLREVRTLQQKLSNKKTEAEILLKEYTQGIDQVQKELSGIKKRQGINNFSQAIGNNKIHNGLVLIQRRKAYNAELEKMILKLTLGVDDLDLLQKTTEDDLKMSRVFNAEELAKIAGQIDQVITKYAPDAGALVVNIDPKTLPNLEQIWQEIK